MNKQIEYLENKSGMGMYIHIPFCANICSYCDFAKMYYKSEWVDQYLIALKQEILSYAIHESISSIYIGGGTPSSLDMKQLETLFLMLLPYTKEVIEFTVEVNPENMNEDKIKLFKKYGVTRLSIGVQTFNESILKEIGRAHHNQEVFELIELAHRYQFHDISIDMMFNLPKQTLKDIEKDLEIIQTLPLTHISYYSLILEEHTILYSKNFEGMSNEEEYEATQLIYQTLAEFGFDHYEISNYAKKDHYSLHNLRYWLNLPYYGLGLGAHGCIHHVRYANTKKLSDYHQCKYVVVSEEVRKDDQMFETIMLGLRLSEGVSMSYFEECYQSHLLEVFDFKRFIQNKWVKIEDNRLKPTRIGMDFLDTMLVELMK